MTETRKPLMVIGGPTASGKSDVAAEVGKRLGAEIISADSMQVYRYMDIGSAKTTLEEMLGVPHHMIDVVDPDEAFDVTRYAAMAKDCINAVSARGRLPILCGGTGFYIQAVVNDIDFEETEADTAFREAMTACARENGPEALFEKLRAADPLSAEVIHPHNVRRVIRALEYFDKTGRSITEHNKTERQKTSPYDLSYFCLTDDRAYIYDKIEKRVDFMLAEGLVDEVAYLRAMGFDRSLVSMQGIGYKEILDYLDGLITYDETVRKIKLNTRHYAKRQLTWFRRERDVDWLDCRDFDRNPIFLAEEICRRYQEKHRG